MTKQPLKREDITSIPQILNCKRMAKTMWVNFPYSCPLTRFAQHQPNTVSVHGTVIPTDKKHCIWIGFLTFGYIAPDYFAGRFPKVNMARLCFSARTKWSNKYFSTLKVDILESKSCTLADPQASIEEQHNDRHITVGS
jgi:hypothetical protein